jgi:Flp pilus assembly protein TadG
MFGKLWFNLLSCQKWACAVATSTQCAGSRNDPTSTGAFRFDFLKRCIAFVRDRRGVSAVEFALLLPLMVTLYFGSVQLSQGIGIYGKVSTISSTVANLATQFSTIANADMSNMLAASSAIIAPYSTTILAVTVSGITIDKNGKATIAWSDTVGGTARSVGQVVVLSTALAVPNTFLVWGECQYAYTPPIGAAVMGTITLKDKIFMSPRISNTITRVNS